VETHRSAARHVYIYDLVSLQVQNTDGLKGRGSQRGGFVMCGYWYPNMLMDPPLVCGFVNVVNRPLTPAFQIDYKHILFRVAATTVLAVRWAPVYEPSTRISSFPTPMFSSSNSAPDQRGR
jgi:hypothetical protein